MRDEHGRLLSWPPRTIKRHARKWSGHGAFSPRWKMGSAALVRREVRRLAGFCRIADRRCGCRRHVMEDGLAAVAELRALLHHAGGDALDVGDFRGAKPHRVAGAHLLL